MSKLLAPFVGYVVAALILALGFGGVQTWRIGRLKHEANVAAGKIVALNNAKAASEAARGREADAATNSFNALQSACAVSLVEATKRGRLVERIIHAPPNPDGSRGLVSDVSLRALLGQAGSEGSGGSVRQ